MSLFSTRQAYHADFPAAFRHLVSTKRAKILFELYLNLETAYSITHSPRMIFSNKNATKTSRHQSLSEWYKKVDNFEDRIFSFEDKAI